MRSGLPEGRVAAQEVLLPLRNMRRLRKAHKTRAPRSSPWARTPLVARVSARLFNSQCAREIPGAMVFASVRRALTQRSLAIL